MDFVYDETKGRMQKRMSFRKLIAFVSRTKVFYLAYAACSRILFYLMTQSAFVRL